MQIKGAIFDMDGTLIDSLWAWEYMWENIGKACGLSHFRPSETDDKAARTMLLADVMVMVKENYNLNKSARELLEVTNATLRDFYKNKAKLKKGVAEFLEYLDNKNVKMCIASASEISLINLALSSCGIDKYFKGIISCKEVGKGKEEPDVFIKAMEFLGTELDDTWLFEDSLLAVKTASKIGLKTVGVYDINNYGQTELKKISNIYISENQSFGMLIK